MSLEALRAALPDYAADIARNLVILADAALLTDQQKWGTFLASAHATGVKPVLSAIEAEAAAKLSSEAVHAAKTASTMMAMNNVYHRAVHLMQNGEYRALRAGLRMNAVVNPGVERVDFELWELAVS